MSYCAGWKHKDSVYLLADTVAAKSIAPCRRQISLGELLTEARQAAVEESSLKLFRIAPGTAVACSGDTGLATQIVDFLRSNQGGAAGDRELLMQLEDRWGPFSDESTFELLLASSCSDGSAELLHWSAAAGLDTDAPDFCQIGLATPYHAALSPDLLSILSAGDLTADRVLPVITAIVQSHGVRNVSIDLAAEGLIFGLRTEAGTVAWQEDTLLVLYDQAFASSTHLSVLPRNDELVVHSSDNDTIRVFSSSASMPPRTPVDARSLRRIQAEIDADRFRYRVFISTSEKLITVIIRNDLERESRYLRLKARCNGQFDFALSPELTSLLLRPLQDRSRGSLPLQLSVRED